ncbi:uncharacterized protein Dyak_GE19469, isoform C [Drosophila yakuba]|uniref:Uncharacterized protein, isoform C n=1 Tax=Drosophila yakuba TaxID=7245 RepID=A0A0R1E440_DROYA|nr:uncharacterized protein Dyak_GE19469, isoform C [Drosophila yakuba]
MTMDSAVCLLTGHYSSLKLTPILAKNIISDEAHFWMNGFVNKIIAVFETKPINTRFTKCQCIRRKRLFDPSMAFIRYITKKTLYYTNIKMEEKEPLIITQSGSITQPVKRQGADFEKKTKEEVFSSRFHENDVEESRCSDYKLYQLKCKNNNEESSLDIQIAESSSKNSSRELKPYEYGFPKDKQIINEISDELTNTDEYIHKVRNLKKSECILNFDKCSEINLTDKSLHENLNVGPMEKIALDKQAMFIKFQSLELCADKVFSLRVQENFCTDIHKCVVDSKQIEKCLGLDYKNIERYACNVSNGPRQNNTTSKPLIVNESRPIYPNVPYSPYSTPFSSPRSSRRKPAFRESRRISIDKSGSFLQLNQYRLMEQIGQCTIKKLSMPT